jgi:pyrroloquinoline quinone (PQQ) biosynthesis protein C
LDEALADPSLPSGVSPFVRATLNVAISGQPHQIAAAFAYGREAVIPEMFRKIIDRLAADTPHSWDTLRYYLDRHIGRDAEQHAPHAARIVRKLCGADKARWAEATEVARTSLEARIQLWDAVAATVIESKNVNFAGERHV